MLKSESLAFVGVFAALATIGLRQPSSSSTTTSVMTSPAQTAAELLAADRGFSAAAANENVVDALATFLAPDVIGPAAGGVLAKGRDSLLSILRRNPDNLTGHLSWSPYRVGVSADGTHGFTYGWMTLTKADSTRVPLKYLAYWVKGPAGWRAVAYKRVVRPAGDTPDDVLPPILPRTESRATSDAQIIAKHAASLADAERAFSALAGKIGLGEAFRRNADAAAMNMGTPQSPLFVLGPDAIAQAVGGGSTSPSPLTWGPDEKVIVSSSGDLGVTVGWINIPAQTTANGTAPAGRVPFFTVWMRRGPDEPWRFVAE